MSPEQTEDARRAVERVRADLGESRVRSGRDHDVLEAARWASELLADVQNLRELLRRIRFGLFSTDEAEHEIHVLIDSSGLLGREKARPGDANSEEFRVARNAIIGERQRHVRVGIRTAHDGRHVATCLCGWRTHRHTDHRNAERELERHLLGGACCDL